MLKITRGASIAFCLVSLSVLVAVASAAETQKFGAPITIKKSANLKKLAKDPAKFEGRELRIEGIVQDVCQGRGCWIDVANGKGVSFLAKSIDESVLVPKDCKGQKVVVQGVVTMLPAKEHDHAHEASDHVCPSPKYVLSTAGVELIAAK